MWSSPQRLYKDFLYNIPQYCLIFVLPWHTFGHHQGWPKVDPGVTTDNKSIVSTVLRMYYNSICVYMDISIFFYNL